MARLGWWDWDARADIVTWSDELRRILGFEPAALQGNHEALLARIHPEDRARVVAAVESAVRERRTFELDHRIVRPDGRVRVVHSRGEPTGEAARPGVIAISQDVTEQRQADAAIRRALSLLGATLEATTDGILVVDRSGRITRYNERYLRMWNIPEHIAGSRDYAAALAFVADQLAEPDAFVEEVKELDGRPKAESFDVLTLKDGRVFESSSQPQRLGDEVVGRVVTFRDVTERRRVEAERDRLLLEERAARCTAEEALRARDEFLSLASHELRGPVASLQLSVQGLLSGLLPGAARDERSTGPLRTIERQTRRLSTLVGELLDVARIRAGALDLNLEELDLSTVIQDVLARLSEDIARSGSDVSVRTEGAVVGRWDRSRLDQIMANLLSNALRHGAGRPIEVTAVAEGDTARLMVRDHGCGVAPELVGTIFERFTRGSAARTYGGLGLGLYLAQQIASRHGGKISVTSDQGEGSTFTVELPRGGPV